MVNIYNKKRFVKNRQKPKQKIDIKAKKNTFKFCLQKSSSAGVRFYEKTPEFTKIAVKIYLAAKYRIAFFVVLWYNILVNDKLG